MNTNTVVYNDPDFGWSVVNFDQIDIAKKFVEAVAALGVKAELVGSINLSGKDQALKWVLEMRQAKVEATDDDSVASEEKLKEILS